MQIRRNRVARSLRSARRDDDPQPRERPKEFHPPPADLDDEDLPQAIADLYESLWRKVGSICGLPVTLVGSGLTADHRIEREAALI